MLSRASEKEWGDGWGQQQEQHTGASGNGVVTQVGWTAIGGAYTCSTGIATPCDEICEIWWKSLHFINNNKKNEQAFSAAVCQLRSLIFVKFNMSYKSFWCGRTTYRPWQLWRNGPSRQGMSWFLCRSLGWPKHIRSISIHMLHENRECYHTRVKTLQMYFLHNYTFSYSNKKTKNKWAFKHEY